MKLENTEWGGPDAERLSTDCSLSPVVLGFLQILRYREIAGVTTESRKLERVLASWPWCVHLQFQPCTLDVGQRGPELF